MIFHITYLSNDGLKVKGYLGIPPEYMLSIPALAKLDKEIYPLSELPIKQLASSLHSPSKDIMQAKLPALIYCRGGIGKVGKVKLEWIEQFTAQGYIIFAPSYRGNEGGEGRDEFGGADQADALGAIHYLQQLPFVRTDQISVMGFSRGSINAAHLAGHSKDVHKLILWSGVSDLSKTYEERIDLRRMLKRVIGGTPNKVPEAYEARSPIHIANQLQCPILLIHGTDDTQVDFGHSLKMYQMLIKLHKDVSFHQYEGLGHHFPAPIHLQAVQRMFEWIRQD
ncbi:S9 family peptidase [Paenibacillus albiflavus]|uniref:S9 family peptidase n=1 Tax=Paenibacillus albiflavus TaxID=2545760 RepID=A0A4R4ED34_9BACL|nr:prolyl oligopeptidase family serine peptidase [Paenibacillus albiflavus]TCZ77103.1 S9 family peptidase [Paenibacillus albiflavus]